MLIFICPEPREPTEVLKNAKTASKLVSYFQKSDINTKNFVVRAQPKSFRNGLYLLKNMIYNSAVLILGCQVFCIHVTIGVVSLVPGTAGNQTGRSTPNLVTVQNQIID